MCEIKNVSLRKLLFLFIRGFDLGTGISQLYFSNTKMCLVSKRRSGMGVDRAGIFPARAEPKHSFPLSSSSQGELEKFWFMCQASKSHGKLALTEPKRAKTNRTYPSSSSGNMKSALLDNFWKLRGHQNFRFPHCVCGSIILWQFWAHHNFLLTRWLTSPFGTGRGWI